MNNLPFSIPVQVYDVSGAPTVGTAPYVSGLSNTPGQGLAVLYEDTGSSLAGLYVWNNNRWNFAAPYLAVMGYIISGGVVSVYLNLAAPATPGAGDTVFRNGVQSTATTLAADGSMWTTVGLTPAGGYVLPAASASVLGGVKQGTGVTIAGDGTISVAAGGTVTSVAMTIPSFMTLTGTPITGAGTLALGLATQAAAVVFAGPLSGGNAVPTFRALATTDIPSLPYAPLASPSFTGTVTAAALTVTGGTQTAAITASGLITANGGITVPAAETANMTAATSVTVPTVAVNTNTNAAASTAFVLAQAATVAPVMDGVAAIGVATTFARQDHVHASDTSRAPTANPTFTGTLAAATVNASGQISTTTAGAGLTVKGGTNAKIGTATLVAGTVTVANTAVTANSRIFYNQQSGALTGIVVIAITPGTGFTLTSSINTDTTTFAYFIVEQS